MIHREEGREDPGVCLRANGLVRKGKAPVSLSLKKKDRKKNPSNSSKAVTIPKRIKNILDLRQGGVILFKWVGWNYVYSFPESSKFS